MSNKELLRKASEMASRLTDPSTKKSSFYCQIRRKADLLAKKEYGFHLELRKSVMTPWITVYLYEVYLKELPIEEERLLTSHQALISYLMSDKIPDYLQSLQDKKKEVIGAVTSNCLGFVYGNRVPKRGGRD